MLFRVYFFNGFHFLDKIEKMVNCWSIIFLRDVNIFNKTREETLQTSITYNKYKIFTRQSFLFKISKSKVLQKYYSWIYDTDIYSNSIPLLIYAKALSKMEIYLIHGLFFDSTPLRRTSIAKGKLNHRGNNAYLSSSPGNRILRTRQETIYVSHGTRNDMLFPLSLVELKIIFQHRDTVYISPFYFTYVSRFGSR